MSLYKDVCSYITLLLNLSIVIFRRVTTPSSKYADINTLLMDSLIHLTVRLECLPKHKKLKEGAHYCPGKIQNSFIMNIIGFIYWMYMCGGSSHMKWMKKNSFDNTKVRADFYGILGYLISNNLGITNKLQTFTQIGSI